MTIFSYILIALIGVLAITCLVLYIIKKVRDKKRKSVEVKTTYDRHNK